MKTKTYYILTGERERCPCGFVTPDYARFPDPDYKCPKCTAEEWAKELVAILCNSVPSNHPTP